MRFLALAILLCAAGPKWAEHDGYLHALRDSVPIERIRAMNGLADLDSAGTTDAFAILDLALHDPDPEVRQSADWALPRIKRVDDAVMDRIAAAVAAPDTFVRGNAAAALGHYAKVSPRATPLLLSVAADTSAHVRAGANEGLSYVGKVWPGQLPAMVAFFAGCDPRLRFNAGAALVPAGAAAIPPLLPLLSSADWNVRANAARTLGFIGEGDGSVGPALAARLADPDFRVRQYALQALGRLDTPLAHDAYVQAHGGVETHGPPVRSLELHGGSARPETSLVAVSAVYRETRPLLERSRGDLPEVKIAEEWRLYLCDVEKRTLEVLARIPVPPEMRYDFGVYVRGWQGEFILVALHGSPGRSRNGLPYTDETRDFLVDTTGRMRRVLDRPKPDYNKNWRDTPQGMRHFLRVHVVKDGIGKFIDDGPEERVFAVPPGTGDLQPVAGTR